MAQEEIFDIYDDNGVHIGVKPRSEVHRDGDWHCAFHCWIIHPDGYLLLQQRSADKDVCPNMLDISAAGHYCAGETMRDGVREVEEELGIRVGFEELIPLGLRMSCMKGENVLDRHFSDAFLYVSDRDLMDYHLQLAEVTGLLALPIEEGIALVKGERDSLVVEGIWYDAAGVIQREHRLISAEMFIPTRDRYFLKVLLLARRCLQGETDLYI
jgi:8-oxo-dGTP pyrophosphatase MutT (NUDIX family)